MKLIVVRVIQHGLTTQLGLFTMTEAQETWANNISKTISRLQSANDRKGLLAKIVFVLKDN